MSDKNASAGTFRVVGIAELDAGMIARRIGSNREFRVDEVDLAGDSELGQLIRTARVYRIQRGL